MDKKSIYRTLLMEWHHILLEDTQNTCNINMHSYECFAVSYEEAYGKMCMERPEFKNRVVINHKII